MIHEEIVTYEVCKLAKEKGFNLHCVPFYALEDFTAEYVDDVGAFDEVDFEKGYLYLNYPVRGLLCEDKMLPAPTQSLLQRWLREEKGVTICVDIFDDGWFFDISTFYKQDTGVYEVDIPYKSSNVSPVYDTYELALEDALKYALENLV